MQQILCHSQWASRTHFSHCIQTKKKHITGLRPGVLVGQTVCNAVMPKKREEEEDNEDKEGKDEGEDEDEENECLQFEVSVLS